MDSINIYDIKAEKANAILKHRKLRKIGNFFRLLEVFVVLLLIFRFSLQLPRAVKNSGFYFQDVSGFMFSPRFVFVVGNIIVIILFAKSGKFSAKGSSTTGSGDDFYDEFVQNTEKNQKLRRDEIEFKTNPIEIECKAIQGTNYGEIVPAQTLCSLEMNKCKRSQSGNLVPPQIHSSSEMKKCTRSQSGTLVPAETHRSLEVKKCSRSQSGNLERELCQTSPRVLKRSQTEKFKKNVKSDEKKLPGALYPEDGMSNDEFRCKVEAFIARQQKFRLQEEYSGFYN